MDEKENSLNTQINKLITSFFASTTLTEAQTILNRIKEKLLELSEYYRSRNIEVAAKMTDLRVNVWDAYADYLNGKRVLVNEKVSDERGRFTISFSNQAIIFQNKNLKLIVTPNDLINRMKLAGVFMRVVSVIEEVPKKVYSSIKEAYHILSSLDEPSIKNVALNYVKNWVRLFIQWKLEVLSFGVIIAILKGDIEELNELVKKHVLLISQLDALFKGQRYLKTPILDQAAYTELKKQLIAKYYDLTRRKGGLLGGAGSKDIFIFVKLAENIEDITVPNAVKQLSFKELFPKELENEPAK